MATLSSPPQGKPVVKRDGFSSAIGLFAATLGSALGLGNIWKFPSLTGTNGGAAFVITYIIATLVVGLPVMISELAIGRKAHANAITSLRRLAPGKAWWLVGAAGALAAFLILAFYTEVAGWVFAYIFKSASGALASTDPEVTGAAFNALISNPWQSLLWQWLVLALITGIIIAGVSKGIERATKILLPVLFVILIIVGLRSLTLPGKSAEIGQGLSFLFKPDFT
ncbi:MAG: sodium-dependent transporter, partial [Anaerolineae bacterium]